MNAIQTWKYTSRILREVINNKNIFYQADVFFTTVLHSNDKNKTVLDCITIYW